MPPATSPRTSWPPASPTAATRVAESPARAGRALDAPPLERARAPYRSARPRATSRSARGAEDLAELLEHLLLVLAHPLGVEAEEAALLRRARARLGGLLE